MNNLKVIFMGTPDFSVPVLKSLIETTNVIGVVTQADKLVGRKKELTKSPIKLLAEDNNIEVIQPIKIREDYQDIINLKPDIIITCAYGQIIPKEILDCPKYGCINVHASLLPKYRGGAPIHKAIIDGEKYSGITIMYMDEGMDTGDIITQEKCLIKDSDNVGTLHDKLSLIGANLLIKTLPSIIDGSVKRIKQDDSLATIARIIKREDERLDFNNTGKEVINKIRGLNPFPLANMVIDNVEYKVIEAYFEKSDKNSEISTIVDLKKDAIGIKVLDGIIYITKIKPFGKKTMTTKDYLNGIKKEILMNKKVS